LDIKWLSNYICKRKLINDLIMRKSFLLMIVFLSFSTYLKSQGGILLTLGSPINQKIEQDGIEYNTGGYSPNIDISGFGFGEGNNLGWGGSITISSLDIRSLPERVNNKSRHATCGFYTGPALRPWTHDFSWRRPRFLNYFSLIINAQVGLLVVNTVGAMMESTPAVGFSIKTSADIIFNKFSIGVGYRPLDLLMGDENTEDRDSNNWYNKLYTLKPAFEVRVSVFFELK